MYSVNTDESIQIRIGNEKPISQKSPFFHFDGAEPQHTYDHRPEARYCPANTINVDK